MNKENTGMKMEQEILKRKIKKRIKVKKIFKHC